MSTVPRSTSINQWVGWREHLNRKTYRFSHEICFCFCIFSLKPIIWINHHGRSACSMGKSPKKCAIFLGNPLNQWMRTSAFHGAIELRKELCQLSQVFLATARSSGAAGGGCLCFVLNRSSMKIWNEIYSDLYHIRNHVDNLNERKNIVSYSIL